MMMGSMDPTSNQRVIVTIYCDFLSMAGFEWNLFEFNSFVFLPSLKGFAMENSRFSPLNKLAMLRTFKY